METIKKLYSCECGGEGLGIEYDKENNELCIAFWALGDKYGSNVLSLKERIRWMWHILITGSAYTDMVILSKETAKIMAEDVLKQIE